MKFLKIDTLRWMCLEPKHPSVLQTLWVQKKKKKGVLRIEKICNFMNTSKAHPVQTHTHTHTHMVRKAWIYLPEADMQSHKNTTLILDVPHLPLLKHHKI